MSGSVLLRPALVVLHRWLGLGTAGFLFVAGITGSVIAFHHEVDAWLNPGFYAAKGEGPDLPPSAIAAAVERARPEVKVWYMELTGEPGESRLVIAQPKLDAAGNEPAIPYNWFHVDPATGEILGKRFWAKCCLERENLVPFLYELHYKLMIPGQWGLLVMGAVALLWTVDCFIGLALTFPRGRPFLAKWRPAWAVRPGGGYRLKLDLHRAPGLWFWLVLLLVAVSGLSLTLRDQVVKPVVALFSPVTATPLEVSTAKAAGRKVETTISFDEILARATEMARARGWSEPASEIFYGRDVAAFGVAFGDHDDPLTEKWLYFTPDTGAFFGEVIPGGGTAGDVFLQLQYPIHGGRIAGLFGRVLIAVTGVVVALLSVTGVLIWWHKRRARRRAERPAAARSSPVRS